MAPPRRRRGSIVAPSFGCIWTNAPLVPSEAVIFRLPSLYLMQYRHDNQLRERQRPFARATHAAGAGMARKESKPTKKKGMAFSNSPTAQNFFIQGGSADGRWRTNYFAWVARGLDVGSA
jgi:hypothetical protein